MEKGPKFYCVTLFIRQKMLASFLRAILEQGSPF